MIEHSMLSGAQIHGAALSAETSGVQITALTDADQAAWDAYVRAAPDGLPLHLSGWRDVMRRTYGYKTPYLLARKHGRVVGVLPLFQVNSLLLGRKLSTMPGGLCADDAGVAAALIDRAAALGRAQRVARIVLQDARQVWSGPLQTRSDHVHWLVDLTVGEEALWNNLHSNIRRQVRIGRRNGLRVDIDRTGAQLDAFYTVFGEFCHGVGTPVFGRSFLANIIDVFPNGFNMAIVYQDDRPIGGYFQLEMGQQMLGMWGATLRETFKLRPVYLAYWEMLADAAQRGFTALDMGRSPAGTNMSKFKGQWGGESSPVYQQHLSLKDGVSAESVTTQVNTSGLFQKVRDYWPRLPLPVAQYLGPKLRKQIPFA